MMARSPVSAACASGMSSKTTGSPTMPRLLPSFEPGSKKSTMVTTSPAWTRQPAPRLHYQRWGLRILNSRSRRSRAAGASGSLWRARWRKTRKCSCSMSRPIILISKGCCGSKDLCGKCPWLSSMSRTIGDSSKTPLHASSNSRQLTLGGRLRRRGTIPSLSDARALSSTRSVLLSRASPAAYDKTPPGCDRAFKDARPATRPRSRRLPIAAKNSKQQLPATMPPLEQPCSHSRQPSARRKNSSRSTVYQRRWATSRCLPRLTSRSRRVSGSG